MIVNHEDAAHEVRTEILKAFPDLDPHLVRVDVLTGASMVDVTFPAYQAAQEWANIEVKVESSSPFTVPFGNHASVRYGFSIVNKDSGFGTKPDCMFAHVPTLIVYLKRCFPRAAQNPEVPSQGPQEANVYAPPKRKVLPCNRECGAVFHLTGGAHRTDCQAHEPECPTCHAPRWSLQGPKGPPTCTDPYHEVEG